MITKSFHFDLENYLFYPLAAACLVYPFLFIGLGIDLTDSGYTIVQGMVALEVPESAITGTWLSNLLGGLWGLFFGYSLFSFRVYGSMLIILSVLIMYWGLKDLIPRIWLAGSLLTAEVLLRRLITVGSYNQVFMLSMVCCTIFVLRGLANTNRKYLLLGGFFLALGIFARLPSVVFLVPCVGALIADALISRRGMREFLINCAYTISGVISGTLFCFAIMAMVGVLDEYLVTAIMIFNTGNTNSSSHGFLYMLNLIVQNHKEVFGYSAATICGLTVGGYLLSRISNIPAALRVSKIVLGFAVLLIVSMLIWAKPLTLKNYDLMTMTFLQVSSIFLLFSGFFYLKLPSELRILSILSALSILFIPFGTNNGFRYAVNASFIFVPTIISVLQRTIDAAPEAVYPIFGSRRGEWTGSLIPVLLLSMWSFSNFTYFGLTYVYRDSPHQRLSASTNIPALRFQKTTPERATELDRIYTIVQDLRHEKKTMIAYGAIPLMHAILNIPPQLSNPWPDLESYDTDKMEAGLARAEREKDFPLVIIAKTNTRRSTWPLKAEIVDRSQDGKYLMLQTFLANNQYLLVNSNTHFDVFSR